MHRDEHLDGLAQVTPDTDQQLTLPRELRHLRRVRIEEDQYRKIGAPVRLVVKFIAAGRS